MSELFKNSDFNKPIGNWDVSNVTDMSYIFTFSDFNQIIDRWCVKNIQTEPLSFSKYCPLSEKYKPKWGTCPD